MNKRHIVVLGRNRSPLVIMGRALGYLVCAMSVGCVSNPETPSSITEWRRVHRVEGCVYFTSYRGRAHDISIELDPEFERSLLETLKLRQPERVFDRGNELGSATLEQPLCWYEMPSGDVLLRAGSMCGTPFEAQFRSAGLQWDVIRFEQVWIQCDQRALLLNEAKRVGSSDGDGQR